MCCTRALWNVIVLGVGFLLLFSAYNTIQGYASTLLGPLGDASLALVYGSVAASVLLAPWAVAAIGPKRSLVLGAAAYFLYMLGLVTGVAPVILAGSVVIGIGSAALWVAFGIISNANAAQDAAFGKYLGFFWAFLQLSNVLGNLATFAVLKDVPPGAALFGGFAVAGGAGTAVLCLLRPVAEASAAQDGSAAKAPLVDADGTPAAPAAGAEAASPASAGACCEAGRLASAACRALASDRLARLLPLFALTGLELAFWSGTLPLLSRPDRVGLVLAAVGVADVAGGAVFGWLGDVLGRGTVACAGSLLIAAGCGICICVADAGAPADGIARVGPAVGDVPVVLWAAAVAFGLGDAALNTQAYAVLGDLYEDGEADREGAAIGNAVLQLLNSLGSTAGFYAAIPFPLVVSTARAGSTRPHAFSAGSSVLAIAVIVLSGLAAVCTCAARGASRGRWFADHHRARRRAARSINSPQHGRRSDWADDGSDVLSV